MIQASGIFVLVVFFASFGQSQSLTGDITFYTEWKGGYGSCGLDISKTNQFYVAALSSKYMALPPGMTNPNNHPLCASDKCLQIWGARGSVVLKISDTCAGCKNDDVDVADTVFPLLDDPDKGRVQMNWQFVDCNSNPPGQK